MNEDFQLLKQNGQSGVVEVFSRHRERLERVVEFRLDARLRRRVDSADVMQEAFIEIARRIEDYLSQPHMSFYVWARQITVQVLIGVQRRHFGQKRDPRQEALLEQSPPDATSYSIAHAISAQNTPPSQAAIRAEEIAQLHSALATMDDTDREVLAMRHFEQLSNNEVAEALGISISAASNRYVRAMTRLSEIMKGDSG